MNLAIAWMLALALAGQQTPLPDTGSWPVFEGWKDGSNLAVDPASVKAEGKTRHFRARLGKTGDDRFALMQMVVDCTAATLEPIDGDRYEHGVLTGHRPANPQARLVMGVTDDPTVAKVLALVCNDPA